MRLDEVERRLQVAIGYQSHEAFAAAARIGWPDALLDLKEAYLELDDANALLLRQMRMLVKADEMVKAWGAYAKGLVKVGPFDVDKEFTAVVNAMEEYQELRTK